MRTCYLGQLNSSRYSYIFIMPIKSLETYLGRSGNQVQNLSLGRYFIQNLQEKSFWIYLNETLIRWLASPYCQLHGSQKLAPKQQDASSAFSCGSYSLFFLLIWACHLKKKKKRKAIRKSLFFPGLHTNCILEKTQKLQMNKRKNCSLQQLYRLEAILIFILQSFLFIFPD